MNDTQKETDDNVLVTMIKAGNATAFNQLLNRYRRSIYNLCYHMLTDSVEAEDAAQEVFIRAYFKLDSYDESRSKFSTWLFSIASHYCIDKLRPKRLPAIPWDELSNLARFSAQDTFQPEKMLLKAETTQEVRSLLNKLPPNYRAAIILKYWHGKSYEDIAQTQGTTVSAIKSRLFRARKMMAQAATHRQRSATAASRLAQAAAGIH